MSELSAISTLRQRLPLRLEDGLLALWVAVASPLLFRLGGDQGPFDANQPLVGLIRLGAVAGVVVCLAARRQVDPAGPPPPTLTNRGALGPFVGGMLLITIAGFTALSASSQAVLLALVVTGLAAIGVRLVVPPLAVPIRRALVSPFVMVAAGLYWTFIESTVGAPGAAGAWRTALLDPRHNQLLLLFLVGFSAVYYAMLIFAPRQIAEREGGLIEWLIRYLAFVTSIVLGIGWLGALST